MTRSLLLRCDLWTFGPASPSLSPSEDSSLAASPVFWLLASLHCPFLSPPLVFDRPSTAVDQNHAAQEAKVVRARLR